MEREAGALKLSLGIAATIVVVLLAAFMLAILDGRLGLGLGIADVRTSVPASTGVPASTPAAAGSARPLQPSFEPVGKPTVAAPVEAASSVAEPSEADRAFVTAFNDAVAVIAKDTPEMIQQGISQMRAIKTSDLAFAKRIDEAVKAAEARLEQLSVRRGL
jgi:hypothetical protein